MPRATARPTFKVKGLIMETILLGNDRSMTKATGAEVRPATLVCLVPSVGERSRAPGALRPYPSDLTFLDAPESSPRSNLGEPVMGIVIRSRALEALFLFCQALTSIGRGGPRGPGEAATCIKIDGRAIVKGRKLVVSRPSRLARAPAPAKCPGP